MTKAGRVARQLLVWLHVVSSVGWMSQALALAVLLGVSLRTSRPEVRSGYAHAAELLDSSVLIFSANASALTGFLLAATTTWGYFQHWWVTAKFVITFTQLYAGIFVLSASMPGVVAAADTGTVGPTELVIAGALLMAGALGFQAWLSVAKPWGKTPAGRRADVRPIPAPPWILVAAVAAVAVDVPLGVAMIPLIENPAPAAAVVVLTVALVARTRRHRRERADRIAEVAGTEVTVTRAELLTHEVLALDLTPVPQAGTVAWEPGAHIDLCLPSGLVRQYSLHGSNDAGHYSVAVLLEPDGRGGSREIHGLTVGRRLAIRGPRNHFPLIPAPAYLFVAGGIGIVPLLPMIDRLESSAASGTAAPPWSLLYRGRSLDHLPYADDLRRRFADLVTIAPSDTSPRPDLDELLRDQPEGVAVYCCGPETLMTALEQAMPTACPTGTLHLERFVATDRSALANEPFEIELAYSRQTVTVSAEAGTLDALRTALPDLPASCETGLCGTCRMTVLAGRPDHRDDILTGGERTRTDLLYPCVSRSLDPRLVVDA